MLPRIKIPTQYTEAKTLCDNLRAECWNYHHLGTTPPEKLRDKFMAACDALAVLENPSHLFDTGERAVSPSTFVLPKINNRPEFQVAKGSYVRVMRSCEGFIVELRNEQDQALKRGIGKQRKFFDTLVEKLRPV